jgi:cellulose 1,4-beta-cellobiosidase
MLHPSFRPKFLPAWAQLLRPACLTLLACMGPWACAGHVTGFDAAGQSSSTVAPAGQAPAPGSGAPAGAVLPTPADPANAGTPVPGAPGTPAAPPAAPGAMPGNPFTNAVFYVDGDYSAAVDAAAAAMPAGSSDAALAKKTRQLPTAVWLDRIAAIAGTPGGQRGLAAHLDEAVAQGTAAGKPAAITLVIYDLPGRDCHSLASNGELQGKAGLQTYKVQYIDAIAQVLQSKAAYRDLHLVLIMEPDSLPNMVTNLSLPACAAVAADNLYIDGITYAIGKLSPLPNVSIYLDIAHSGWLGWPMNMAHAITLYMQLIGTATHNHPELIRGFATDIANYTPLQEPFLNATNTATLNGTFYQSNPVFDEQTYVAKLTQGFVAAGLTTNFGFLIDTSRSGWPKVNDGRPIDRRHARGNWCNATGAGLGMRPQVSPPGVGRVDAFVYVKPPGTSDGISSLENPGNVPDAEGKRFDPDCAPATPTNNLDGLAGAPSAGQWFASDFIMLLRNATPAL